MVSDAKTAISASETVVSAPETLVLVAEMAKLVHRRHQVSDWTLSLVVCVCGRFGLKFGR